MKPFVFEANGFLYRVSDSDFEGLFIMEFWVDNCGWTLTYSHDFPLIPGLVTELRVENYKRGQVVYSQDN